MSKAPKRTDKKVTILVGVVGLVLAYALAMWALDTASYWLYLATFLFLGLSIRILVRTFKK